jgi:hypothetical protein
MTAGNDPARSASAKAVSHGRTARLYALVARERRVGVIFRRGPSSMVRLIGWNLERDRFRPGQWLKARVYEHRCDLSPDGSLLCYFAATYRKPYETWTAISRPPYFTALALWPKGDAWGGGGLFDSAIRLRLNHRPSQEMMLAEDFTLPKRFVVEPLGDHSGWGEDAPIDQFRLERDGWYFVQPPEKERWVRSDAPQRIVNDAPAIISKPMNTRAGLLYTLRILYHGRFERDGRSYVETADIVGPDGSVLRELGRVDWADLDHNGDVLWAWAGKLWRLPKGKRRDGLRDAAPRLLADFNDMRFEAIAPPSAATRW